MSFDQWVEIYQQYQEVKGFALLRHAPGLLAVVGTRDFWSPLTEEQKKWSLDVIKELALTFAVANLPVDRGGWMRTNIYDTAAVVEMLPQLLLIAEIATDDELRTTLERIIFFVQVAYFQDNSTDYKKFVKALHIHLWPAQPGLALGMWYGALALGRREGGGLPSRYGFATDEEYLEAVNTFLDQFLLRVRAGEFTVDFKTVDFNNYHPWALVRAIKLLPDANPPIDGHFFLSRSIATYLAEAIVPQRTRSNGYHELKYPLQDKLARIFLESALGEGARLMDFFCKLLISQPVQEALTKNPHNMDLFFFFYDTIKEIILVADRALTGETANDKRTTELFQAAWKTLAKISMEMDRPAFLPLLLLDIKWNDNVRHWTPIEGMQHFLLRFLKIGTALFPGSAINLLASVGDQTLLPEALSDLVNQLQSTEQERPVTLYKITKAEQLARRLYEYHLDKIRADPALMTAYHWLLDKLIDQGSTDAYWLNEFIISYHRQTKP